MKIVHIMTGETLDIAVVQGGWGYRASELKKDGTPNQKKRGRRIGVEKSSYSDGSSSLHYNGSWVEVPADDSKGVALRAELAELQNREYEVRLAILRHYSGQEGKTLMQLAAEGKL